MIINSLRGEEEEGRGRERERERGGGEREGEREGECTIVEEGEEELLII